MIRGGLSSSRVFSPLHEESGDEDLTVLPRHTKVIVTGNNRTKSVLIGLQGVVKNAVGHGGWHWLVLTNGDEVKLQRNALSVLEPPTGNEEDNYGMENLGSDSDIQEKANLQLSPTVRYTKLCTPAPAKSAKLSNIMGSQSNEQKLKFSSLSTRSLLRYWRRCKLGNCSPNISNNQLVTAVQQHFISKSVDEDKVILEFIRSAKRLKLEGVRA